MTGRRGQRRAEPADGEGTAEPSAIGATGDPSAPVARRRGRRARTEPPAGSDPAPEPEPRRHSASENDDRLRADRPPHY